MEKLIEKLKFEKYSTYKDSKTEWIGNIPEHWEVVPGFTLVEERKEKNRGFIEKTVLSLSYGNVIVKPEEKLTGLVPESFETYQLVYPGDIIIRPTDLQNDKTSLRTGLAKNKGIITSAYINLRIKNGFSSAFYHYFLHSVDITKVIYGMGSGLRQNLDFGDFKRFSFLLPPKKEQEAIVTFLDRKTAQIDKAIIIKEKQIELLKERRQILIHQAVTRGLNPNVKMKDSGVEWIGEIPEHWDVTSVKHVLDIPICDGPHTTPQLYDEGIPFISAEAIKNGEVDFEKMRGYISLKDHHLFSKKYSPKRNDIYMVKSGATTGNVAMVNTDIEFSIWSPLAVFRANSIKVTPNYLHNYLESPSFKTGVELSWSYGTQQNIGMGILSNLPIAYPSIDEQISISDYIGRIKQKTSVAISIKEKEIEKLREYKATLINSAVTGKIKVTQDA